jgi:hypothetical protein
LLLVFCPQRTSQRPTTSACAASLYGREIGFDEMGNE